MASLTDFIRSLTGGKSATKSTQNAPVLSTIQPKASPTQNASAILGGLQNGGLGLDGQVLGANYTPNTGSTSSGSYGVGTAQPDTTGLQNTARGLIQSIQNAYNSLTNNITPVVQDKLNQYLSTYNQQTGDLNKSYGDTVGQTQNIFGARGLGDSSFLGNALDSATNTYNENLGDINTDKQNNLAAIGQYANGLQNQASQGAAQYGSYLPNLGQYSSSDLQSLNSSLQSALPQVQSTVNGIGTNQDFLNTLNQYAPQANQGTSQLANQLQQLVTSSAPIFAKNQIASGIVNGANLQDPNAQSYWNNYYQQLLNGQS